MRMRHRWLGREEMAGLNTAALTRTRQPQVLIRQQTRHRLTTAENHQKRRHNQSLCSKRKRDHLKGEYDCNTAVPLQQVIKEEGGEKKSVKQLSTSDRKSRWHLLTVFAIN